MTVADWAGTAVAWNAAHDEVKPFVAPAFRRVEQRATVGAFIDGLLSRAERKTGWMLAEEVGHERTYRMQSLLGRSSWSADALCALVRRCVVDALGDGNGVLVVDETSFIRA